MFCFALLVLCKYESLVWCVGESIQVIQFNKNELRGKKGQREMRMKWEWNEHKVKWKKKEKR